MTDPGDIIDVNRKLYLREVLIEEDFFFVEGRNFQKKFLVFIDFGNIKSS